MGRTPFQRKRSADGMSPPNPAQHDCPGVHGAAPIPRLETERLILRPLQLEDFDAWAELSADEETMHFLGGVQPRSVAWRSFLLLRADGHCRDSRHFR